QRAPGSRLEDRRGRGVARSSHPLYPFRGTVKSGGAHPANRSNRARRVALHVVRCRQEPSAREGEEARASTASARRFVAASTISPLTREAPSAAARIARARSSSALLGVK